MAKRNKSALKANRQNIKRREANRQQRSKLRTGLKKLRETTGESGAHAVELQSLVDKMAAKGLIHRNTAARHKSRQAARLAKSAKSAAASS